MRFRKVVVAALLLVVAVVGALGAYQVAEHARHEAAQSTVERTDSLAVEPGYKQKLVSDDDHDPTRYGANGTETVEYNGTVWEPSGNYTYYNETGEIEFLRDEPGEANITYQYEIPENQVADDQLQTATKGFGKIMIAVIGLAFVSLFLFIAAFAAKKMGIGNTTYRGR